jgi:hypothetical protein
MRHAEGPLLGARPLKTHRTLPFLGKAEECRWRSIQSALRFSSGATSKITIENGG